ncbi:MAG: Zn-ribbon domain-containing OB-fold protein [Candidatus Binataceae bacterium]
MDTYVKPLPKPTETSRPFWDAAKQHRLQLQHCGGCQSFIYYPRDRCPHCLSDQLEWRPVSGKGKVYSYTTVRRASVRSFADKPYVLAIVELDEGVRMTTNIEAPPETVKIGMPVTVFFDDVTPERTLVKFRPA